MNILEKAKYGSTPKKVVDKILGKKKKYTLEEVYEDDD